MKAETIYRAVIILLLGVCSFFLVRMSNQFDRAIDRIVQLEIRIAVMESNVKTILKQTK